MPYLVYSYRSKFYHIIDSGVYVKTNQRKPRKNYKLMQSRPAATFINLSDIYIVFFYSNYTHELEEDEDEQEDFDTFIAESILIIHFGMHSFPVSLCMSPSRTSFQMIFSVVIMVHLSIGKENLNPCFMALILAMMCFPLKCASSACLISILVDFSVTHLYPITPERWCTSSTYLLIITTCWCS